MRICVQAEEIISIILNVEKKFSIDYSYIVNIFIRRGTPEKSRGRVEIKIYGNPYLGQ
jgi:hypothetical protein